MHLKEPLMRSIHAQKSISRIGDYLFFDTPKLFEIRK